MQPRSQVLENCFLSDTYIVQLVDGSKQYGDSLKHIKRPSWSAMATLDVVQGKDLVLGSVSLVRGVGRVLRTLQRHSKLIMQPLERFRVVGNHSGSSNHTEQLVDGVKTFRAFIGLSKNASNPNMLWRL